MKYRKLKAVIATILIASSLTACGEKETEEPTLEITDASVEKDLKSEFEKRPEVEDANIQLETIEGKDFIYAHIKLSEEKDVEKLANEYKEMIQESYPDRTLDLIISKGEELLFQETFK